MSRSALIDALNLIRAEWHIPDHWWENSPESRPIREYIAGLKIAALSHLGEGGEEMDAERPIEPYSDCDNGEQWALIARWGDNLSIALREQLDKLRGELAAAEKERDEAVKVRVGYDRWLSGGVYHTTKEYQTMVVDKMNAATARADRMERALTATNPINGDNAMLLAEVAKNVCYWRGKDMCLPDPRDYREASSHIAVIRQALRPPSPATPEAGVAGG